MIDKPQQQEDTKMDGQTEIAIATPQKDESATVMGMLSKAVADGRDIATLEKLMDLQERVLNRNAEQAFNAAFSQMQAELPEINESGEIVVNNEVRSTYAKHEDINEAIKPILHKYGFGISHRIHQYDGGRIKITGILRHQDGHSESTDFEASADTSGSKNNVQAIKSTIKYGQRITICALLNISSRGEDDDAQTAGQTVITTEQAADIDLRARALEKHSHGYHARFLKWANVKSTTEISQANYKKCLNAIATAEKEAKTKAK